MNILCFLLCQIVSLEAFGQVHSVMPLDTVKSNQDSTSTERLPFQPHWKPWNPDLIGFGIAIDANFYPILQREPVPFLISSGGEAHLRFGPVFIGGGSIHSWIGRQDFSWGWQRWLFLLFAFCRCIHFTF